MMKYLMTGLFCVLLLAGCDGAPALIPLDELPADYSLEQAKADGCLITENGEVTSGQEAWEQFLQATAAGKKAALRMGDYYTLDESRCTPEYYAAAKGDYPMFFLSDLSYDGEQYTVTSYEDGKKREDAYAYLRRFEGPAESPNASYQSYIRYIVTNHDTASWEEILFSSASSQLGAYIPYVSVYTELIG